MKNELALPSATIFVESSIKVILKKSQHHPVQTLGVKIYTCSGAKKSETTLNIYHFGNNLEIIAKFV